jgi:acetyl esterase/lipase
MNRLVLHFLTFAMGLTLARSAISQTTTNPDFTRKEDVIYGRKHGMALTLDVFTPKDKPNGLGVIFVISGGWFSSHDAISPAFIDPFIKRGYTVFAVVHGSQPRFTIPECIDDMNRSVRFIRHNASSFGIDPERIGIYGLSAGGHLSLMQGLSGDKGKIASLDAVSRSPSRVKAVAAFFPPTDFLNYSKPGEIAIGRGILQDFKAAFDFHHYDIMQKVYVADTDESKIQEIGRTISPVNHVSKDDPPVLILHGDADKLVPIQQAELIIQKLRAVGVPTKLVVRKGKGHGWENMAKDMEIVADWFDEHLKK